MANQRMYLRCTGCGGEFYLGKRMAGGYYTTRPMRERIAKIDKYYDEHEHCDGMPDNFELVYEVDQEHYGRGLN